MSQRNPMNARNQGDGPKGHSRKSAGTAKPKRKAAESIYVPTAKQKADREKKQKRQRESTERDKDREADALAATVLKNNDEYKRWRRIWVVCVVIAVVGVILSFILSFGRNSEEYTEGQLDPFLVLTYISLGIGYVGIIAAFIVDFRKVRPLRKAESDRIRDAKMSPKEKKRLAEAEAEKEAQAKAERQAKEERRAAKQAKRQQRKGSVNEKREEG